MPKWLKERLKGLVASAVIGVIAFQIRKGGTVSGLGFTPIKHTHEAGPSDEEKRARLDFECESQGGVIEVSDSRPPRYFCKKKQGDPWIGTIFQPTPPPKPRPVMDAMEKKKEALVKYGVSKRWIGKSLKCTKKGFYPKSDLRNCGFWNVEGSLTFDQAAMYVNRRLKGVSAHA